MDDKSRIVKATEGLKGVAQQALAIKDSPRCRCVASSSKPPLRL